VTGTAEAVTEIDRNLGNGKDADNTQKERPGTTRPLAIGDHFFLDGAS
jgi:hypothetical protein